MTVIINNNNKTTVYGVFDTGHAAQVNGVCAFSPNPYNNLLREDLLLVPVVQMRKFIMKGGDKEVLETLKQWGVGGGEQWPGDS